MRFLTTMVRSIFDHLQGSWTFERTFQSFAGISLGSVTGVARFSPKTQDVYHYQEEGALTDAFQKQLKAHKEYLYCYQQEEGVIEKHFSDDGHDQGLFYPLKFDPFDLTKPLNTPETVLLAHGKHLCANDRYEATIRFYYNQNVLTKMDLEYEVSGPKKNYIAKTVLHPFDPPKKPKPALVVHSQQS